MLSCDRGGQKINVRNNYFVIFQSIESINHFFGVFFNKEIGSSHSQFIRLDTIIYYEYDITRSSCTSSIRFRDAIAVELFGLCYNIRGDI